MTERERLAELREVAVDERLELLVGAGGHQQVLSELRGAALAAPTRKHRAWLLAIAFYRCERQADALSTITAWTRRLRHEFGPEPGSALRDLEQRILHHDPELDAPLTPPILNAATRPAANPAAAGPHGSDPSRGRRVARRRRLGGGSAAHGDVVDRCGRVR